MQLIHSLENPEPSLESEELFRLIVSSVKDYAIFMLDPSGHIISWNEGAERIKGYKKEEIVGQHMSVFYTPDAIRRGEPHYNLLQAKTFGRFEQEGERVRKDGSVFWANVIFTALRDPNGNLIGFTKVTRDITEKKKLELQLQLFNKELEAQVNKKTAELTGIFERITDGFIALDKNFCYTYLNKKAGELIHLDPASLIGRYVWDVFPDAIGSETWLAFNKAMAEQRFMINTDYYPPLDLWQENHLYPSPDGLSVFIRDITERKKAEDLLNQSYQDIRQLASHLQDVREDERASIAREIHDELGQQLTGMKMDLSWISKRKIVEGDDELKQKTIIVMNLLDTTIKTVRRIATDLRPSILDDLGLIAAIEWQSEEFERRSGIRTEFISCIGEFNHSSAIAICLFRICQESLTNIARHAEASLIRISLQEEENEFILLKIEDNGKGFEVRKIGDKKTLGLLGMKERTQMMGGEFRIESEPGKGTTLFVTVPITSTS